MKSLNFVGVVEVRPGKGNFVADGPSKFLEKIITQGVLHTANDFADLFEARVAVEPELAALSAQRLTADELNQLVKLMEGMKRALADGASEFAKLDLSFHLAIAAGSKNRALTGFLNAMRGPLLELIAKGAHSAGGSELAYEHHLRIMEALRQHNSAKARSSMRAHLRVFQRGYMVLSRVLATTQHSQT